jgi:hypothetical protein
MFEAGCWEISYEYWPPPIWLRQAEVGISHQLSAFSVRAEVDYVSIIT